MAIAAAALGGLGLVLLANPAATLPPSGDRDPQPLDGSPQQCERCQSDWAQVSLAGRGPANGTDLCSLVDTCASDVAECDWTLPPDEVFASCTDLRKTANPQAKLRQFKGRLTGANTSSWYIEETKGPRGPFVLYIAPQFSGDWWNSAAYYVFSYLATQGIATFTATIPDAADAQRDSWNHLPSSRPYPCLLRGTRHKIHQFAHCCFGTMV